MNEQLIIDLLSTWANASGVAFWTLVAMFIFIAVYEIINLLD